MRVRAATQGHDARMDEYSRRPTSASQTRRAAGELSALRPLARRQAGRLRRRRSLRARCSWASGPATRRTCVGGRSSARRGATPARARRGGARQGDVYPRTRSSTSKWRPKERAASTTPSWSEIGTCDVLLRIELARVHRGARVSRRHGLRRRSSAGAHASARSAEARPRAPAAQCAGSRRHAPSVRGAAGRGAARRRGAQELVADLELVRSILDGVAGRRGVRTPDVGSRVVRRDRAAAKADLAKETERCRHAE